MLPTEANLLVLLFGARNRSAQQQPRKQHDLLHATLTGQLIVSK
jgi:hypothetical protein